MNLVELGTGGSGLRVSWARASSFRKDMSVSTSPARCSSRSSLNRDCQCAGLVSLGVGTQREGEEALEGEQMPERLNCCSEFG